MLKIEDVLLRDNKTAINYKGNLSLVKGKIYSCFTRKVLRDQLEMVDYTITTIG